MALLAATVTRKRIVILVAKGIKLERVTPSRVMNKIREGHGKPPKAEHNIVVIDPDRITRETAGTGTNASPRLHWRRGNVHRAHERTLVPTFADA